MKKGISIVFALYLVACYAAIAHGMPLERKCAELKLLSKRVDFAELIIE